MFVAKLTFGLLALLHVSSVRIEARFVGDKFSELSVSELLHKANIGIVPGPDEPKLMGDIALTNADPCTAKGCLWPKKSDGKVYVPYVIANDNSSQELEIIQRGLDSFASVSCIRFIRQSNERDYIRIKSDIGCYSYVGRQGNAQILSLARNSCLYHKIVQHELIHALGFNHEQSRSDRDNHILIKWENVKDDMEYNFDKISTLNQETPYDYNSVMQYERNAFSKNGKPTMIPIPDENVPIGKATKMSENDILRINRLYKCSVNLSSAPRFEDKATTSPKYYG